MSSSIHRVASSRSTSRRNPPNVPVNQPEDEELEDEHEQARKVREQLPLWKRPARWWLLVLTPFSATVLSLTISAQVELFTELVCRIEPPDYQPSHSYGDSAFAFSPSCSSDPKVQATVTRLTTVITVLTGIIAFFTVGRWGSFSDRHGRTRTLGFITFGQFLLPFITLIVVHYGHLLPGGYWLLLSEAVVSGFVGSSVTEPAIYLAYLSDITTPDKRAGHFSALQGGMLAGIGVGPLLGSFIIQKTGNLLSVFYLAALLRFIQSGVVWLVLPESLTPAQMQRAIIKHEEDALASTSTGRPFFFLEPLLVLLPAKITRPGSSKFRRDWNLTLLAASYALMFLAASSLINQFYYALYMFQWDAEYLGYCISVIGLARALFLTGILPPLIRYFKQRPPKTANETAHPSERDPLLESTQRRPPSSPFLFDLRLARVSVFVDLLMYATLPLAPSGALFILFTTIGSLGAGLNPAVNAVALELYKRKVGKDARAESGKLLGGLSVVQAVFANVLGPLMYGSIYASTVATSPRTIFFVALGNATAAFLILTFVRVSPVPEDSENSTA
ncbi:MFS domain-containing protein [Favolaschia claudopus]|uniref:MFS domain-containing protein n=1 Tax=Favolaschia claudopus TaxID=2862362 RepID=A0AAW0E3M1_9AGAR